MDFPGTVTLSSDTLEQVAYEVAFSLVKHGFKKILFENGHGGNTHALEAASHRIKAETKAFVAIDSVSLIPDFIKDYIETAYDAHAGEFETSTTLANREKTVVKERIRKAELKLPESKYTKIGLKETGPKVSWSFRTREISETGVIGDPTKASKEKGEKAWNLAIERLADLLTELDKMKF
jgi:creatinine amidohydrolase